jgi:hypothetical protein|tara:strand:+ start:105 stop:638 length:534 start_codon:yes stop_codon:yes gene_type:complete
MAIDHLNDIERALIDNLRLGKYNTVTAPDTAATGNAWTSADVTVFGQFPTTVETKYPCIITEMAANGIETQFMGQRLTSGSSNAIGELYGVAFNIYVAVDSKCSITVGGEVYKERRLLNYLMLNCANVLMDVDFPAATVPATVVERHFSGFRDIGYNPDLETWNAISSMVIVFKNSR